jgi:hypothetical protein
MPVMHGIERAAEDANPFPQFLATSH